MPVIYAMCLLASIATAAQRGYMTPDSFMVMFLSVCALGEFLMRKGFSIRQTLRDICNGVKDGVTGLIELVRGR